MKHLFTVPGATAARSSAPAHTSQRIMGKSTWMQGCSSFTIPCRIKHTLSAHGKQTPHPHTQAFLHLWNQILLDPLQLGLLPAIFGHHRLLVELVGQVSVLVVVQRAGDTTQHWNYTSAEGSWPVLELAGAHFPSVCAAFWKHRLLPANSLLPACHKCTCDALTWC